MNRVFVAWNDRRGCYARQSPEAALASRSRDHPPPLPPSPHPWRLLLPLLGLCSGSPWPLSCPRAWSAWTLGLSLSPRWMGEAARQPRTLR